MNLSQLLQKVETAQLKQDVPSLMIGDTVSIGVTIQEGNKQRVQNYQGTIIAQHRAGLNSTITVRRVFQGVGVERIFPLHSPAIQRIEVVRRAEVRRAKLYYLRDRVGKATRLNERIGADLSLYLLIRDLYGTNGIDPNVASGSGDWFPSKKQLLLGHLVDLWRNCVFENRFVEIFSNQFASVY